MSEAPAPRVKHSKSFKKYGDEFRPEVVAAAREWALAHAERVSVHEDASLIKITGLKEDIDTMVSELRSRFGSPLPGEDPPKE